MVAPLSLREFREMTDVRKLLEKEAIKLSLSDGDDDWEGRVVAALHRVTKLKNPENKMSQAMKEWEDLNEAFHEALVSGCSSVWLLNFRRSAYYYAKRYLQFAFLLPRWQNCKKIIGLCRMRPFIGIFRSFRN